MLRSFAMNHRSLSWLIKASFFIASFALITSTARAGWDSVEGHYYPSVVRLDKTETGFRAVLGRRFMKLGEQGFPIARPILRYIPAKGWEHDGPYACGKDRDFTCLPKKQEGESEIPAITLSREEAIVLRPSLQQAEQIEQKVYAWTEYGGFVWFGIGFYAGEGFSGVGGIGRYNSKTQRMEFRRPELLREFSVSHMAHDGETLWLGTAAYYEGSGSYGLGLVRYDWKTDRLSTFEGTDDGPCGFTVHDLLLEKNSLWVATDLGLSRWDRKARTWNHYVPDPGGSPPMRASTCPELYASLLKILPRSYQRSFDTVPYSELFQSIKQFRPRFLTGYVRAMPPADWGCDELKFLAEGKHDFQTLKAELLSVRPLGSPHFKCVLEGFAGKNARDPEWRDLLLSSFEKPGEKGEYRDEVVLDLLKNFPGDSKVGEALALRLKTVGNPWREAELLPTMLGEKSVPPLIEALDRFQDFEKQDHIMRSIIRALGEVTGLYITPNGLVRPVTMGADPDDYLWSDEGLARVASYWQEWWKRHETDYGAAGASRNSQRSGREFLGDARPIEAKLTLSSQRSRLLVGDTYVLDVTVTNLAEPNTPPLPNFPLSARVVDGPHAGALEPLRGTTDAHGKIRFSYKGLRGGKDTIAVSHEGGDVYMRETYAEVAWGGPDLVVTLVFPPMIKGAGGEQVPLSDWTQNRGADPAGPSVTRYFLSPFPGFEVRARIIGEREVPPLRPGERSELKRMKITLPSDLPEGRYYIAACADSAKTVAEVDEQNNCSFKHVPGYQTIIVPAVPSQ